MTDPAAATVEIFLAALEQVAPRPMTIVELARRLDLPDYDRRVIKAGLEAAVERRRLRRIGKTRYQWRRDYEEAAAGSGEATAAPVRRPRRSGAGSTTLQGHYERVRAGYGFVEVLGRDADRFPRDILIPAGAEGTALHGDRVEVTIVRHDPRTRRAVGEVVRVVTAVHETLVGTLERTRRGWAIVPEQAKLPVLELRGENLPTPEQAGLVARARITRQDAAGSGRRLPSDGFAPLTGELLEVLGTADNPEVQFLLITEEHGLRTTFPEEATAEAQRLPEDPSPEDWQGREDLRDLPFVTIDGETARDFDDAVCLQTKEDGTSTLWVAIADVAHYVRPGSALDREALRRGNSVYFPDRAIPMLPPELSSGLCSLLPRRERLVLFAALAFDRGGHRRSARFGRGVIRSHARLTYTQVAAVLAEADTEEIRSWRVELAPLLPEIHAMHRLMQQLQAQRLAAGSLDLDLPEALIDLSEEGRSVGLRWSVRNDAHRMIEEFMLEANRAVAAHLREHDLPLPYRIHEPPSPEDIDDLNGFLGAFGFGVEHDGIVRPGDVARLLTHLGGHRLSRVLSRQVLRALKQAQYSIHNVGHFGLAFPIYCHFTSPIRRYPDLLVHRQLGHWLDGELESAREEAGSLEAASVSSSQCERQAMAAERAMLDLKKCEFMLGHLLEPGEGTIVSVTHFGMFVELDAWPVEGLVRLETIADEPFRLIEEERALCGLRTNRRLRIGDRVRVECSGVSLRLREIDLRLLAFLGGDDTQRGRPALPVRRRRPEGKKGRPGSARPKPRPKPGRGKGKAGGRRRA